MSITLQLAASATLTCATRGSRARAAASIFSHSATLSANGTRLSGSSAPYIAWLVRCGGGAGGSGGRVEQLESRRGTRDRGFADLIGMGEGGCLAGHSAQAEARRAVIVGGLQATVVEAERLARAVLQIELAIIVSRQMLGGEPPRAIGIEAAVEEPARVDGHAARLSAGPPMSTKRRSQ